MYIVRFSYDFLPIHRRQAMELISREVEAAQARGLTAQALAANPTLEGIAAYVPDSGEGRWTVAEAIDLGCSIPVITLALQRRFRSREPEPFGDKLLAAMRNQFGGHAIKPAE